MEFAVRQMPLDVAYLAELTDDRQLYRAVAGDAGSFNIVLNDGPPLAETLCSRMVAGEIPHVVPDTGADARVAGLPIVREAAIGAYVGVPVHLSDGTPFGSLCGLSHTAEAIDEGTAQVMSMLGELIVDDLDELKKRQELRRELTGLIERESVEVAYQPIFGLPDGRCIGLEALARFPDPFAKPDQTLAAAGRVGLEVELERLVVSRAWAMLPKLGVGQFLAVNVSPAALLELAHRANQREELPLDRIVVEVTEHAAVEAYAALRGELAPLRQRGLRIAVDDAGAGYASLRHVLELRPDFIKLDRWLIHGLADDCARRVAVCAFVSLARELGSKLVAEGVERPADLAAVRDLGLEAAQGFLLGRPTIDQQAIAHRWLHA